MKFELARGRNFFHTIWTPHDLLLAFKEDISDGIQFFFTKEEEKSILSICEEQISKSKLEGMSDDQYDKELILVSLKMIFLSRGEKSSGIFHPGDNCSTNTLPSRSI